MAAITDAEPLSPQLIEQHHLIRPNRSWAEILLARQRLSGLIAQKAYDGMESDLLDVENYADVLRQSWRTIALAICMATHLRRYVPGNRFDDAMKALSSGLEFPSLDDSGRRAELERCVRALLGGAMPDPAQFDGFNPAVMVQDVALGQWLQKVNALPALDLSDIRTGAWAAWASRLEALAQNREEPADLDYLRCRAEGSLAGTCLPARLSRIGIAQLSNALTASLVRPDPLLADGKAYPPTFPLSLLTALRFDVYDTALMRDPELAPYYTGATISPSPSPSPTPGKGLLIIRSAAGSTTANWKVVPTIPAISTTLADADCLFAGRINLGPYLAPRIYGVLFEVDQDAIGDRAPLFQAFLNRFPADLKPLGALLVTASVANKTAVPASLRRFAVAPGDQSQAATAFL